MKTSGYIQLLCCLFCLCCGSYVVRGQEPLLPPSERPIHRLYDNTKLLDTIEPFEFHMSMGGAYIGSSYTAASVFGISPSAVYRPNDRVTVKAGFSIVHSFSLMPEGYRVSGYRPRSLAPYRNPDHMALSATVSATYKVNDRLWIAASLMHMSGDVAAGVFVNPWYYNGEPMPLNATAFSAAMRYRFGDDNYLNVHFTYIDDRTGALGPMFFGGPYGSPFYYEATTFGSHLFFNEW